MNPDKPNHAKTRRVSSHARHNSPGPRRCRSLPVFLSAALMMTAAGAGLHAQTVINTNTTAGGTPVNHTTGGTLAISATVFSTGGNGVQVNTLSATLVNEATGRIETAGTNRPAVYFYVGDTLLNAGVISATTHANDDAVMVAARITGSSSGRIEGARYGMQFASAANGSVLTNSGTITVTGTAGRGVSAATGASIELINESSGRIQAVYLFSGGTVTNHGVIQGGLAPGSTIDGLTATGALDLANTGTIDSVRYGVQFGNGSAGSTLDNGGVISGSTNGLYVYGAFTGTNRGLITGNFGVQFGNAAAANGSDFVNTGTIRGTGGDSRGISSAFGAAHVRNESGGLIEAGFRGVYFSASGGTVTNSGAITAVTTATGRAIQSDGPLSLDNSGLVQGLQYGVWLNGAADAGSAITNSGVITGGSLGVNIAGGAAFSLLNTGTITGAVASAAAVTSATLAAGGKIDGVLALAGNASTLTLAAETGPQSHAAAVTGSTMFTGTLVKVGAGTWDIDSAAANLAGLAQQATLVQAGTLAVDWAAHQLNAAAGAAVNVDSGATLQVRKTGTADVTFANPLTGAGYVALHNASTDAGGRFVLAASTGSGVFTGTLGVSGAAHTGRLLLDDAAGAALARATLSLGVNSETALDADLAIHALDFDGGLLLVSSTITAAGMPVFRTLTVDLLAGTGGTIGVTASGLDLPRPPGSGALTGGIFDLDTTAAALNGAPIIKVTATGAATLGDGTVFMLVDGSTGMAITTTPVSGSAATDFYDATGATIIGKITDGYKAVYNAGSAVATGTAGIYFDYGVTAIESTHATIPVTLDPAGAVDKTLGVLLTGTGVGAGFTFTGTDTITLAQKADYTGATLITGSAVLKAGDGIADIIASSMRVTLDGERTGFDLGTANQTLKNLSGSGFVALRDATLTVDNSDFTGTLSGAITGAGGLTLSAGGLALTGAAFHTGTTAVQTGATLTLGDGATRGVLATASRVTVAAGGTLALWRSDAITFANTVAADGIIEVKAGSGDNAFTGPLTGSGTLVQNAAALATLSGANDIALLVNRGTVQIGAGGGTGNGWATDTLDRSVTLTSADAKLVLNRPGSFTIDTVIAGAGAVDIIGTGVTAVLRSQTYAGATLVRSGTLRAGTVNVLAASAGLTLENAAFELNGHDQTLQRLHGHGGNGATIFYHADQSLSDTTAPAYATLTVGALTGATVQHMNVDMAGRLNDKLQVNTLATGTHHITLHRTTTTEIDDAQFTYALDMLTLPANASADPSELSITSSDLEMGAHTYRLIRGDDGRIYLSGVDANGDARSRAGDAIYWTAGVAGLDWHYSLDSLRKRMGELRMGGLPENGNVWVTANTYRVNAGAGLAGDGFKQDSFGMTAGGDRRIDLTGDLTLLAGGFLSFARHERDFENHGGGETSGFGLGGYATVLHKDGWYGDFVLRADRSANKLHTEAVDGFVTAARYGGEAVGASLELGRHVTAGALWLEPSVQMALARFGGENYDTERQTALHESIHVRIDGSTAAQYRLQLRGGVDFDRWRPYLRVAEVRSDTSGGKLRVEGREWAPGFDGWRFETGLGVGCLIDAQSQFYFDYEYNKADAYERPWSLSLGYRRAW
ncbi:autotransporter outer membrane beta-barrel domain-containing protein [Termitidicoccus mucosus]|uniref:Autotransporter domain-containing protein n=1 Tax=Termitidicoccus mucosus TaxID=1184151 RepID=A0A178IBV7_9BACT|nr:hypothetical protein AW736_22695 [Opitutaceae bacterium TSB47]